MADVRKGDIVMVKLGSKLGWRKAKVVKRRKENVVITGEFWSKGVTGTLNRRYVRRIGKG